jgi:uncharacterized protein DUF6519
LKGDFSRSTFRNAKKNRYNKVKMQQGRVQIDADWNEQIDIIDYYHRTSLVDIIGKSGAPENENAGFNITPSCDTNTSGNYKIGAGRYYVDGILIENEVDVDASDQLDLPIVEVSSKDDKVKKSPALPDSPGTYLVYLDVWERHITALDDPEIKDSALGGPDTSTRSKIIWQVKLHKIKPSDKTKKQTPGCFTPIPSWDSIVNPSSPPTGRLQARSNPQAGYRGLENQLYRVEIHDEGIWDYDNDDDKKNKKARPTFKWSRDNGIVVTKVTQISQSEHKIKVTSSGKDKLLSFDVMPRPWVEVIDDRHELWGLPGTFVRLVDVKEHELIFDPDNLQGEPLTDENYPSRFNPKVRRWDSNAGLIDVRVPTANSGYLELEDGVQIKFSDKGLYRTGDYWLVPARTIRADVEWTRSEDIPDPLVPEGIQHYYCRLALMEYNGESIKQIVDCRKFISKLTNISKLIDHTVSAAKTGIVSLEFTIPQEKTPAGQVIFDPVNHFLTNIEVPPAIILGQAKERNEPVQYMEDYIHSNLNTQSELRFKAINVNLNTFQIALDVDPSKITATSDSGIQYLILRWWAIPAQEQKTQTTSKVYIPR